MSRYSRAAITRTSTPGWYFLIRFSFVLLFASK